jgi:uncharacterized pyridoxamine 5'-phosphate oxidase family protein
VLRKSNKELPIYRKEELHMDEILKFLKEARIVYIATTDGVKPKVRPFGSAIEYEGKLYFNTNNQSDVYRQLIANPYFEACTISGSMAYNWIRISGKAVFDSNRDAKAKL